MKKKFVISLVAVATLIGSLIVYTNFVKEYELIINNEVISKDTSLKLDKVINKEIQTYQEELVKSSRTTIEDIEKQYNTELDLTKSEEIGIKKVSKYEYKIDVIHKVKRNMTSELPFESSVVEDPNTYSTYSAVQTSGVNGSETTTFTSKYVNGKFIDFKDKDVVRVDPVNEVTVVGTMALPSGSSSYTPGSNYSGGSYTSGTGTAAASSNTGGSSASACTDVLNSACGTWVTDYNNCNVNLAGTYDCPMYWKPY